MAVPGDVILVETVPLGTARVMRAAILEVRVHTRLLCGESVRWVVLEQALQQIVTSVIECGHQNLVSALPLGEGCFVVRERGDAGPCLFVGGTEDTWIEISEPVVYLKVNYHSPEDFEDLINF